MILVADLDRHRERRLIGLPSVGNRVRLRIEAQLQPRDCGMAEILVENWREIALCVLIESLLLIALLKCGL